MKYGKIIALLLASTIVSGEVSAATYSSSSSNSSTSTSTGMQPREFPANAPAPSSSIAGEISVEGVGSCAAGADSSGGTLETGVVAGVDSIILENNGVKEITDEEWTSDSNHPDNGVMETDFTKEVDGDSKGWKAGVTTYVRWTKQLGKTINNVSCDDLAEQAARIARAKADQMVMDTEIASMRAEIEKKKAELQLKELEIKLKQLEAGEIESVDIEVDQSASATNSSTDSSTSGKKAVKVRMPDGTYKTVYR
ncbi:MAG: hypothetical protein N0C84_00365 [Candidatus Thiodiazotropha taylori]|uniref:Secreted protein n=1 Tax=Candidatus Thiodiazotropha taylori TaxID=2792791 RepID=A0A9E4K9C2_9GAMM|nr:hypothetical protein [Candidatus Thiodiazotropha taylori]MCW4254897.1 hypothetical protein [Candidatus Thiodiazotropha taylori]